jgi:penicillin-binding protein 2
MGQPFSFRNISSPHGPRRIRLAIYQAVILIAFVLLGFRIYQVQFIERDTYVRQANENRFDLISVPAPRGIITDRNGVPLAVNVPSFNVTVTPASLPSTEDETNKVLEKLASLINVPVSGGITFDEKGFPQRSLQAMITEGQGIAPYRPVVVKTDVDEKVARIILAEKLTLRGVDIEEIAVRHYPTGPLTSQLIGYMGPIGDDPNTTKDDEVVQTYLDRGYVLDRDRVGYDGVEFTLENLLSGNPGLQTVVRDVAGQIVQTIGTTRLVQPGYSVTLTIDTELQAAAQKALEDEIKFLNTYYNKEITERGVVIATNPRTGEVLAMVSWPTYDNERFARKIDYPYYLRFHRTRCTPCLIRR